MNPGTAHPPERRTIKISVVVCTYNRADLLAVALDSLARQTLDPSEYEVIVVDNNSTDNTRAVAGEFCRARPNFRYVAEPLQGLSHARNRGWRESIGDYIGYFDDDSKAPEGFLAAAREVIERVAPDIFGGPYLAYFDSPRPAWYRYGTHTLGDEPRPLAPDEFLSGTNIYFRRDVLEKLGGFDPNLGMSGAVQAYGEETDLQLRLRAQTPGSLIYYDPRQFVYHLVPAHKMTWRWIIRYSFNSGRYAHRVFQSGQAHPAGRAGIILDTLKLLLLMSADLARGVAMRDRNRYPFIQNYFFESTLRFVGRLGRLREAWSERR